MNPTKLQGLLPLLMTLGSTGAARSLDSGFLGDLMKRMAIYILLFVLFVAGLVTVLVDLFQMTRMEGALSASILGTVGAVLMTAAVAGGIAMRPFRKAAAGEAARSPLMDALTLFLLDILEEKKAEAALRQQKSWEPAEKG